MTEFQEQTRLLLVEDSPSDAELFAVHLGGAAPGAFAITTCSTLSEATARLARDGADCVIVDLGLPDAHDLEAVEILAARAPDVPLVVLTGRDDSALGLAAILAGAGDYLAKTGLDGSLLVRSIRHAQVRKRFENSLAEAQSIAQIGSWEVDLATTEMAWSRELYRLFAFGLDQHPTYEALVDRVHPDDRDAAVTALEASVTRHTAFVLDHRLLLPDGGVRWVRARTRVELDASGAPRRLLGTAQDITEQKITDDALIHQSLHDPLTGLANHLLLERRVSEALARLSERPATVGLVHVDIDRFKVINESLGRSVGDELLAAMAMRLMGAMRPGDLLARIGGDDFVVLAENLSGPAEAEAVADALHAAMVVPLAWDDTEMVVSISTGIATTRSPATDPDSLLRDADAAMYHAKRRGGARNTVFDDSMRATAIERLETEVALRQSLADGDLRLRYQAVVDLATGETCGHEALVRWQHPTRGLIGPSQFISIAEETGMIVPLGRWVLGEACRQTAAWQRRDPRWSDLTISVNLSGAQLGQPDLIEMIRSALADSGLAPESLQLEMTESVLMDDVEATIAILRDLRSIGVHLAIDDFGTEYSSLAYLKRFPVDALKIDRAFVTGLGRNPEDAAIAAAVIGLATALGLGAIAEGVETALQVEALLGVGCRCAQGFYFGRPVEASVAQTALDAAAAAPVRSRHLHDVVGETGSRGVLPGGPTGPPPPLVIGDAIAHAAADARLAATRSLLRVEAVEEAVGVCITLVRALGGRTIPARLDDGTALPIDCSFGHGEPLLPVAEAGPTRRQLELVLPSVLEDAREAIARLRQRDDLSRDARTDPLTGLLNRRAIDVVLSRLAPGDAVILIDLDHFKQVNDTLGHAAGDGVLTSFSRSLRDRSLASDHFARVGGDEMLAVLCDTDVEGVAAFLARLSEAWRVSRPVGINYSAGVAWRGDRTVTETLAAADAALYEAKHAGRDRAVMAPPTVRPPVRAR